MMRRVLAFTAAALGTVIASLAVAAAQQPRTPAPARDRAGSPPTIGSSIISGFVVTGNPARPVSKARVRLIGPEPVDPVFTDGNGAFAFADLSPGRYTLAVEKSGYARARYGAADEFAAAEAILVTAGSRFDRIVVGLEKGAAVFGRVVDEMAEPIIDARIVAHRLDMSSGEARLTTVSRVYAQTNDLGEYRIGGLAAGRYFVSVLRGGPDGGTTYYPSAPTIGAAAPLLLGVGEERGGIDIVARTGGAASLAVSVIHPGAAPTPATSRGRLGLTSIFAAPAGSALDAAASRSLRTMSIPSRAGIDAPGFPGGIPVAAGNWVVLVRDGPLGAIAHANVAAGGQTPVSLVLGGGGRATGRVIAHEESRRPASAPIASVAVGVRGAGPDAALPPRLLAPPNGRTTGSADGRFVLNQLLGGVEIDVDLAVPGWAVREIRHEGRDLRGRLIDFSSGASLDGVEVLITDATGHVAGTTITADGGQPAPCTVVLFDERLSPRVGSRFVRFVRAGRDGRFTARDLAHGPYLAVAARDLDVAALLARETLDEWRPRATRVEVTPDVTASIVLPCVPIL
jgi:hypothetical protein